MRNKGQTEITGDMETEKKRYVHHSYLGSNQLDLYAVRINAAYGRHFGFGVLHFAHDSTRAFQSPRAGLYLSEYAFIIPACRRNLVSTCWK